jgi:hypothetical protein
VKSAIDAVNSEIVQVITAAVNSGIDVLDRERSERRIILMQPAILASVLSTLTNPGPGLCADHLSREIRWA